MRTVTPPQSDLEVKGRIHSLETFGTVDGPGIRFVLFLQGCALRCQFCHNPDTWDTTIGKVMTVREVIEEIRPYVGYYTRSGGGLTVSGGEPTLQAPFVAALFRAVKQELGIHTALDSSGFNEPNHVAATGLFDATDLVMLDLKMIDEQKHHKLTTQSNKRILQFAQFLADHNKQMWVRHVVIPTITDEEEDIVKLGQTIARLGNVTRLELLPYHIMGKYKWQELGLTYELEHIEPPTKTKMLQVKQIVIDQLIDKELDINIGM
ncbi:pyruvate formate-lyase-activating protein [Paenibacillus yanchengensis]|uniref:Pyruvate formate-lyase-activating enzyme n=1 Tax=Paenibacillus yanchengensis TaxID=2035833 RepID=A0ABW4YQA0_9BACL